MYLGYIFSFLYLLSCLGQKNPGWKLENEKFKCIAPDLCIFAPTAHSISKSVYNSVGFTDIAQSLTFILCHANQGGHHGIHQLLAPKVTFGAGVPKPGGEDISPQ